MSRRRKRVYASSTRPSRGHDRFAERVFWSRLREIGPDWRTRVLVGRRAPGRLAWRARRGCKREGPLLARFAEASTRWPTDRARARFAARGSWERFAQLGPE